MKAPDLGKMVGPLPLGGWVLVIGGGLGVAYVANRNRGNSQPAGDVVDDASGAFSYYDDGNTGIGPSGVLGALDEAPPSSGPVTVPAPTTNTEWSRLVYAELVGRGFQALAVSRALAVYLNGDRLTTQQAAIIDAALRLQWGLPPDPPPASPPPRPETPSRAQRAAQAIDECKAGNPNFPKMRRLGISVNDPRIVGTPCGRKYALWALGQGARPA